MALETFWSTVQLVARVEHLSPSDSNQWLIDAEALITSLPREAIGESCVERAVLARGLCHLILSAEIAVASRAIELFTLRADFPITIIDSGRGERYSPRGLVFNHVAHQLREFSPGAVATITLLLEQTHARDYVTEAEEEFAGAVLANAEHYSDSLLASVARVRVWQLAYSYRPKAYSGSERILLALLASSREQARYSLARALMEVFDSPTLESPSEALIKRASEICEDSVA